MQETQVQSLGWKDPLEKGMATSSSILAWESYGQRSLAGYSPRSHKDLDTTEQLVLLTFTFIMNLNTPEIYRLFFLKKKKKVLSLQISFPQGNILLTVSCDLLDAFLVIDIFYTFFPQQNMLLFYQSYYPTRDGMPGNHMKNHPYKIPQGHTHSKQWKFKFSCLLGEYSEAHNSHFCC